MDHTDHGDGAGPRATTLDNGGTAMDHAKPLDHWEACKTTRTTPGGRRETLDHEEPRWTTGIALDHGTTLDHAALGPCWTTGHGYRWITSH